LVKHNKKPLPHSVYHRGRHRFTRYD